MARRIVDISTPLQNDVVVDPPMMRPKIDYIDHRQSIGQILPFFPGLKAEDLPDGQGWAIEMVQLTTHNGTHLDAPWHYHPTMNDGERASTIDEVPLEWCFQRGVKLDFRHFSGRPCRHRRRSRRGAEARRTQARAARHRSHQHRRGRQIRQARLSVVRLRHGRRGDAPSPRAGRAGDGNRRLELGRAFRPYRPAICGDARRLDHLGGPQGGTPYRLLPSRETAAISRRSPRPASWSRASR